MRGTSFQNLAVDIYIFLDFRFTERNHSEIISDVATLTKARGLAYSRKLHLQKTAIIATSICFILIFIIALLVMSFVILSKVVRYPDIFLVGNITGNVTADLGSLGKVELKPEFQLNFKINL